VICRIQVLPKHCRMSASFAASTMSSAIVGQAVAAGIGAFILVAETSTWEATIL
jgi:hypothetical protein